MTPSINDYLNVAEFQSFVGRDTELQLMKEQLVMDRKQWNLLHFYGINGIGKSTLLLRFMKISPNSNIIYLDTDKEIHTPQHFLDHLAKQIHPYINQTSKKTTAMEKSYNMSEIIHYLNTIAANKPPLILLLDSFEHWKPIMEWLFDSFIPNLSAQVRFISAGRESLDDEWMQSNPWLFLVKNIQLTPLDKEDVYEYLNIIGIVDPLLRQQITNLCNGYPFAMNLCSKKLNRNNRQMETANLKQTIRILCQTVLNELGITGNQRSLIEAASIVGQFDKELLSGIIDQSLSYEVFDRFCELPIIEKSEVGWSIYDGIRDWIQSDFKEHSPELFDSYKKRALEVLYRRWADADLLRRRSLFLENIFAAENELLQEYYFLGDDTVYDIRTARKEDIAPVMDIWKNRHLNTLESVNDGIEQEKLIPEVWELEPSAIQVFWNKNEIAGFASIVTLTTEARQIFLKNSIYRKYLLNSETEENERLLWIGATAKKDDYQTLNAIFRYFFKSVMDNCLFTVMFPTDYDISGLHSLGLKELPWAASETPTGKKFRMLQIDCREISLSQLLTTTYPTKTKIQISMQEANSLMKELLQNFYDFESNSELLKKVAVVTEITNDSATGNAIRLAIKDSMKEIENRTEKDELLMRLIKLTYIDRIGTNEVVAERLHLSISTYYRYVNKGIEKLAQQFISKY